MKRWARRLLFTAALGLALFVFGFVPWFLAGVATRQRFKFPDKENAGLTPASFSLKFEDIRFTSRDGLPLSGWWVPAESPKGTVVLLHGLNRSRLEMVKKTPFVVSQGWNALLLDLRHHGESGGDSTSFGLNERLDAEAAADWAEKRSPGPVAMWGVSLGGATAALAAAEDPDVVALICDSSYLSLDDTLRHHVGLARGWRWWMNLVPEWPVADEALFWMKQRGGFDPAAVDIEAAVKKLGDRPALFVAASGDKRMPKEIAFQLKDAAGARARVLVVPSQSHGGAYRDGKAAYESAVIEVLSQALRRSRD